MATSSTSSSRRARKRNGGRRGLHPVDAYAVDVLEGEVVAGRLVRLACERHLRDRQAEKPGRPWFDEVEATISINFFALLRHTKGEWAKQPIILEPWQAFIIGSVFGWKLRDGTRRFRTAYNEIPRKNGKSTIAAGVALRLAFFDDEAGAEVYCAATKRDQAKIVFDEAVKMVNKSKLRNRLQPLTRNISEASSGSKVEPLGADADTLDGLNPSGFILDELHAHKTRAVVDVMETATGARRQPLAFEITTAGQNRESVCWEHHDYSVKVLEGLVADDSWFAYVATIDDGDDWRAETAWQKANPNYGKSVKRSYLENKAKKAAEIPTSLNAFLQKNLNVWVHGAVRWILPDAWRACRPRRDKLSLRGLSCFGALDLGKVNDLSAFVLAFPEGADLDVLVWFWMPEKFVSIRSKRDRVPYEEWVRQGLIEATPGDVTDYNVIRARIKQFASEYQIKEIDFDPWQATQLALDLQDDGATVVECRQGFASMSGPTKELERLIYAGALRHGSNPVLDWMSSNVVVRKDPAENIKIDKARSRERVDGMVALVMAVRAWIMNRDEPQKPPSIYERRGLIVI